MAWHTDRKDGLRSRSVHWIIDKHKSMAKQAMYFSTMVNQKDRFITEEHYNMKRAISRFENNSNWPPSRRRRANTSPARLGGRYLPEYSQVNLSLPPPPILLQGQGLFEKPPDKTNFVMSSNHLNKPVKKLPFQSLVEYMSNIRRFDQEIADETRKSPLPSIAAARRRQHTPKQTTFAQVNGKNYQKLCHQIEYEPEYFVLPRCRGLTSKSNRLPSLEYLYNEGRQHTINAPTPTPQILRHNSYENVSDLVLNVDSFVDENRAFESLPESLINQNSVLPLRNNNNHTESMPTLKAGNMYNDVCIKEGIPNVPEIVITPVVQKELECQTETCQQWRLHKLACQRELRKRELVRLIEDIKEFNDLNINLKGNTVLQNDN